MTAININDAIDTSVIIIVHEIFALALKLKLNIKEIITNFMKLLTLQQILSDSTSGNVKRTVWRICILMLGCKG